MFKTKKLFAMPYAQAQVVIAPDGNVTLISYTTAVINIDPDGWVHINGLYSPTTRKHIGAFMREYANADYYTAKAAYVGRYDINILTGEVRDW